MGARTAYIAPGSPWENGYFPLVHGAPHPGCGDSARFVALNPPQRTPNMTANAWPIVAASSVARAFPNLMARSARNRVLNLSQFAEH